ncbi:MAG: hypothetical protein KKF50_01305 [Nanoarchaeota archaeon]|nr:hypothetical protein [Nanoarchaeota archaeon]
MGKDNFLDTNIIFHYSNYTDTASKIIEKCYFFVKNKSGRFILCWAVLKELEEITKKRARFHKAIIEKIKDTTYSIEDSPLISFRDIPFAKQIYEKYKNKSKEEIEKLFQIERNSSELKIKKFIQFSIDERGISLNQIDGELINKIHNIIPNHADCKILASALQLQKDRELFLFVTADGKDLDPNGYEFLKGQFEINYSKENWKFPELLNLVYTN